MALPIAQLGYLPSMGTPSHGTDVLPKRRSPWSQLAESALSSVLSSVASNAVNNGMSRDYASEATASDPEQVTAGQAISPETGQPVAGSTPQVLGPQNASFLSRVLQGPEMDKKQYAEVQHDRSQSADQIAQRNSVERVAKAAQDNENYRQAGQLFTTQRGQDITQGNNLAEVNQRYDDMMQRAQLAREELTARQAGTAPQNLEAQAAMERAKNPLGANSAAENASVNVFKAYVDYVQDYAKQSVVAQALKRPLPPMMSQDQFFQRYNSGRPTFGLPQFNGQSQRQ